MNRQLIEIASWRLVSELHRRYPDGLRIIETHPGGGQYDCLSIYKNSRHIADLNRPGSLHIFSRDTDPITNIWEKISDSSNPKKILDEISEKIGFERVAIIPTTTPSTLVYRFITVFLTHSAFGVHRWDCRNGYCDTSGYGGGVSKDFDYFPSAKERLRIRENDTFPQDPAYRFWFLRKNEKALICFETVGNLWVNGSEKSVSLMNAFNNNDRNIWKTVVSLVGHSMK